MAKEGWEKELSPCSLRAVIRGVLVNDILFTLSPDKINETEKKVYIFGAHLRQENSSYCGRSFPRDLLINVHVNLLYNFHYLLKSSRMKFYPY